MLMKKYEEEVNEKQELLELIERLRKENEELREQMARERKQH